MHPTQENPTTETAVASALIEAMSALRQAQASVEAALGVIQGRLPISAAVVPAAVRTTGVQVMHVLGGAGGPLTLQDIADGVVAIRRDEDEPKKHGGTRYQEMCRTALARLIAQGLVERVEPTAKTDRMRFRRAAP